MDLADVVSSRQRNGGRYLPRQTIIAGKRRTELLSSGQFSAQTALLLTGEKESAIPHKHRPVGAVYRSTVLFAPGFAAVGGTAHPETMFLFQREQRNIFRHRFPLFIQPFRPEYGCGTGKIIDQKRTVLCLTDTGIPVIQRAAGERLRALPAFALIC